MQFYSKVSLFFFVKMGGGRKKNKGGKRSDRTIGDVTINDFANSTVCKNRTKKIFTSVSLAVKQVVDSDDRPWDEKLDDLEGDFDFVKEENEDGTTSVVLKVNGAQQRRRKKTISDTNDQSCKVGNEYPLDIWFLISEHIRPEDVGRFAGICRCSLAVVRSAKFWFNIYKRYYTTVPNMPERLQPECMVRLYGLRPCVIRALHYMYPPFVSKFKSVTTFDCDPHILIKRQCVLMWHQKCKNQWRFYFKLKLNDIILYPRSSGSRHQPDLIEMLEDISANQDENCRILQVTCLNYIPTPIVLGLNLASVSLTLSQGLRQHRLKLVFGSSTVYSSPNAPLDVSSSSVIVLEPVINIKVLDWWHPLYPHSGTHLHLLSQE